jgi:hypothetical protein
MDVARLLSELRAELQRIERDIVILERFEAGTETRRGSSPYRLGVNWSDFDKRRRLLADGGARLHFLE